MRIPSPKVLCVAMLLTACSADGGRTDDPNTSGTCDGGTCPTLCDGGSCEMPTRRGFGESCTRNGDCTSAVCLPVGGGRNVCTSACVDSNSCVAGWICDALSGIDSNVCLCASSNETCDGADNDCDGVVDNQPVSDLRCTVEHSAAWACVQGACQKTGCEVDGDCGSTEACNLTTHQCGPTPARIKVCLVNPVSGLVDPTTCFPGSSNPPTISFGSVNVGDELSRTVRVFNEGGVDLALGTPQITSSNPFSTGATATTVPSGDSVDLAVRFAPPENAIASATLTLTSDDALHPGIDLPLTGTGLGAALCVTPETLDFGAVAVGLSRTLSVRISNCGFVDYALTSLVLVNDNGPLFAVQGGAAPLPVQLNVGASVVLNVSYSPGGISATNDTARLTATAGALHQTVALRGQGAATTCNDNGVDVTPTAAIKVTQHFRVLPPASTTLDPGVAITLDGDSSTSAGTITDYSWRLVSQPAASIVSLSTTITSRTTFTPMEGGDYVVELLVGVSSTCQSTPTTVTLHVGTAPGIHVQLTWPQTYGDVDLHYLGPNGVFYQATAPYSDLDWTYSQASAYGMAAPTPTNNTSPDWGLNNTCSADGLPANNATFDLDQRQGYGPEDVTHRQPFDGVYKVLVHYYCNGTGTTVAPELKIFVRGELAWQGTMPGMTTRQVWEAAQITVSNNGANIVVTPLSIPLYLASQGC